jgi:hypothetical protein
MDDDDSIANDFTARIQRAVNLSRQRDLWYSFPKGVRVSGRRFAGMSNIGNQFVSLWTERPDRTVYDVVHGRVGKCSLLPAKIIDDRIAWLWFRHGDAKSPGGKTKCKAGLNRLKPTFSADWSVF